MAQVSRDEERLQKGAQQAAATPELSTSFYTAPLESPGAASARPRDPENKACAGARVPPFTPPRPPARTVSSDPGQARACTPRRARAHSLVGYRPLAPGGDIRRCRQPEQRQGPEPRRAPQGRARAAMATGPWASVPRLRHVVAPGATGASRARRPRRANERSMRGATSPPRANPGHWPPLAHGSGPLSHARAEYSVPPGAGCVPMREEARRRFLVRTCPPFSLATSTLVASKLCRPGRRLGTGPQRSPSCLRASSFSDRFVMPRSSRLTSGFKDYRFLGASSDLPPTPSPPTTAKTKPEEQTNPALGT